MKLAIVILSVLAMVRNADAFCAVSTTVDVLINASGTIPLDGAVLIGTGSETPPPKGKKSHAPNAEGWRLVDEKGRPATNIKIVELAPGIRGFVRSTPAKR